MAITVDFGTRVINVPRADMVLIQSTPTEIRQLDLNQFRLTLKDIEDSDDGMPFPDTHRHIAPITVGGVDLARVVEIVNNYTVTFEDGQYAVNLLGANSNVADRVNVNQVSVRAANSAGLVTSAAIEFGEYGGEVTIDQDNGEAGTIYPIGTLRRPVSNIADAILIASVRGFDTLKFINPSVSINSGDNVQDKILAGRGPTLTTITIADPALTQRCEVVDATVTGVLDGDTTLKRCAVMTLTYFNGTMDLCTITGTITLGGGASAKFTRCFSGVPGANTPTINMGGTGQDLAMRNYNGGVTITNCTGPSNVSLDMQSGQIILDATVTNGTFICRGVYKLTNNSTGVTSVNTEGRVAVEQNQDLFKGTGGTSLSQTDLNNIADAVWDEIIADHQAAGSTGNALETARLQATNAFSAALANL